MKTTSLFLSCFLALFLCSCSKIEYDFRSLGFSSVEEMQAAFTKGYHTKQKLDEMHPPVAYVAPTASPEQTTETKQEGPAPATPDNTPFAPSFDCSKASNKVEKLICADRDLSRLDVELSKAYQAARDASTDKDQLKKDQISWVKLSRTCEDKACLQSSLEMRLKQLKK
jgi:uncharacterized protein YecT (DUF1311 family)